MLLESLTIPPSPIAPNRKMRRRLVLLPFFGLFLFAASYFHDFSLEALHMDQRSQLNIPKAYLIETKTVTVVVHETVTQQAISLPQATASTEKQPIQAHKYRADGLLEVNPLGRHPIHDLIERGEKEWNAKLKKQSKSLDEAVTEYERRYKRAPPKGFDDWWFYCERNNVQLPDEYDQIYNDIEPFWGMNPKDLHRLQSEREYHHDTYTIGKSGSERIGMVAMALPLDEDGQPHDYMTETARSIIDTLKQVEDFIPPFRATFTPHDNPDMLIDWGLKRKALYAASIKKHISNKPQPQGEWLGWRAACAPDSLARLTTFDLDNPPPPPTQKTFIYDHLSSMDPCHHPSILHQHGQFLSHNEGPTPSSAMIPQFSYSVTRLHYDIVPATTINWVEDISRESDPLFMDKPDDRLLWRGTNTGMFHAEDNHWRAQHRLRLVGLANEHSGNISVLHSRDKNERIGEAETFRKAKLNPAMMDMAFADHAHSCEETVCKTIEEEYEFRKHQTVEKSGSYKYIMDVDGNGWSSRFKRLMVSNSLIFKSTVYKEWFTERVQPWVHYIPVQVDLSDLYDSLTFFRGDLNGDGAHEEMAAKIALAGREWSQSFWRKEDITAYMFRLFLEYSRVMSLDREAASYKEWDTAWTRP